MWQTFPMGSSVETRTQREQPWDIQPSRWDIYLPDLADLLGKEMSSSKENTWQQIQSVLQAGVIQWGTHSSLKPQGELEFLPRLQLVRKKPKTKLHEQTSIPLFTFCCFLPWSDSFIANYNQSHYKISSPTSEFVTFCDNHLPVTQFTCMPILQTLNSE